jgi:hypothetical protein
MAPFPGGLVNVARDDKDVFESVWKVIQECGEEERHFNQLQGIYRGLASTWILATLGAVGYLLFNKDTASVPPFQLYLVAAAVCAVGATGVVLIWILDLKVYHRLLVAVFDQGLNLEDKFEWLPRFRTNMTESKRNPVRKRLAYYYVGTVGVPLIAACWFVGFFLRDLNVAWYRWLVALLVCAAVVLVLLFRSITKSLAPSRTGHVIKSTVNHLKEMHRARPVVVKEEDGVHITVGKNSFVLFSDIRTDQIHLSQLTADLDFNWSDTQGDFVTETGEKLGLKVEQLIGPE